MNREGVGKDVIIEIIPNSKVIPDHPGHIPDCADHHVDPSEPPTECNSVVSSTDNTTSCTTPQIPRPTPTTAATTVNGQSGESKVSDSGEDNEGGLSVEDLQRGFREEV